MLDEKAATGDAAARRVRLRLGGFMPPRIPPHFSEVVLLAAVVFGPLAFGATEPWSVSILEGMLLFLAALCLGLWRGGWRHPIYWTVLPGVLVLLIIGLMQYCNPRSISAPAIIIPFTCDRDATGRALPLWSAYAALLFSAPRVFEARAARYRFLWTIFILGSLISIIGLMQRGQGNTDYYGLRPIRQGNPFGPYTNYDHAASMLVMAAFAGLGLWLSRFRNILRIEQTGKSIEAWAVQILIAFLLAIVFYAIVYIRSRGAIHAMAISAAVVGAAALWRFAKRKALLAGGFLLMAAVAAYGSFMIRNKALLGFEARGVQMQSVPFRLALYKNSLKIAEDFPLFGTGLASYRTAFPVYEDKMIIKLADGHFEHAHNDWVELLIQAGVAGFTVYAGSLVVAFFFAVRAWFSAPSSELRWLGGGCLAGVLSFVLHGLADFSFQTPANAVLFLTLLVCAVSCVQDDARTVSA